MTADTAKCAGNGCTLRDYCDRFVRDAVDGQTWVLPEWRSFRIPQRLAGGVAYAAECQNFVKIKVQPHGGAVEEGDGA